MKATHRSIPNDTFIVEEGKRVASILTQWDRVVISIGDPSDPFRSTTITFDQFYMALEAIIADPPLPPPYQPDKEATAPAGDANQAAPEFASHAVGDRVEFNTGTVLGVPLLMQGMIRHIDSSGTAEISGDNGRCYHYDLCALKNLSREEKA